MPKRRYPFKYPRRGRGFYGENNTDALIEELYGQGFLRSLRNYHIIPRGRLQKRQGWKLYTASNPNGANSIQSIFNHQFGSESDLICTSGGSIYKWDEVGETWDDITGSLTLSGTDDRHIRRASFDIGNTGYSICTDNNGPFWYYSTGAGTALAMSGVTQCSDVAVLNQHILTIGPQNDRTLLRYSDPGLLTFPEGNNFPCSRESAGVGLAEHNDEVVLAFHQRSVHAVYWNQNFAGVGTSRFIRQPIPGRYSNIARGSIVTRGGRTFFSDDQGIYAQSALDRQARYISRPIEQFWMGLGELGRREIVVVDRGYPWEEIMWLVRPSSSSQNEYIITYNFINADLYGDEAGWSIMESLSGDLKFQCGTNFIDSDGVHRTILGDYDGQVVEAFGTSVYSTGFVDGYDAADAEAGASIRTKLQTGLMDLDYAGVKGPRELWLDLLLPAAVTFSITASGIDSDLVTTSTTESGSGGALLGEFMVDEDVLVEAATAQVQIALNGGDTRWLQINIEEESRNQPHTLIGMNIPHVRKSMRID